MTAHRPHRAGRTPDGVTTFRAATVRPDPAMPPQMVFAYLAPSGRCVAVITADSLTDAWIIATGCGDDADIREKLDAGWKMMPAAVTWETRK